MYNFKVISRDRYILPLSRCNLTFQNVMFDDYIILQHGNCIYLPYGNNYGVNLCKKLQTRNKIYRFTNRVNRKRHFTIQE